MHTDTTTRAAHLQPGFCLRCGETRVNTAARYEDGWHCAGLGNGDDGCGSGRVYLERDNYVDALEQAYADRFDGVAKMLRELTEYAEAGGPLPEVQLREMCRLHNCEDEAEVAIKGAIKGLVLAEREADKPAPRRRSARGRRSAVGGAA